MKLLVRSFVLGAGLMLAGSVCFADTWPQFRGPRGDGIVVDQSPPIEFGEKKNLTWKTHLPGKAWSSPVYADGVVWVTTAIERIPSAEEKIAMFRQANVEEKKFKQLSIAKSIELKILAIDFAEGSILRTVDLIDFAQPDAIHALNSYASPTPVIDGDRIYCHFGNYGTFCVDRETYSIVWQRRLPLKHSVGPGSSPFIFDNKLVLIQDGLERQYVVALDTQTGQTIWETDRPAMDAPDGDHKKSYSTPIAVTDRHGRDQLICMSSQWMVSYDPERGSEWWRCYHGTGFSVVPRPVYSDGVVFFATGFGKPELWAVGVDGSGNVSDTHVQWRVTKGIPAKPSPVLHQGLIYVMADNGVATCIDASNGDEIWKKRIGGDYSASPLLAGGNLYFGSQDGKVTVMRPGIEARIIAENQVDGQIMASPAVIDDALLLRSDSAVYRFDDQ